MIRNQANQRLTFLLVSSSDHITGVTGASPVVSLSKAGGPFLPAAGVTTEIGDGWYVVTGSPIDVDTLGPLILHATSPGSDPSDTTFLVI